MMDDSMPGRVGVLLVFLDCSFPWLSWREATKNERQADLAVSVVFGAGELVACFFPSVSATAVYPFMGR